MLLLQTLLKKILLNPLPFFYIVLVIRFSRNSSNNIHRWTIEVLYLLLTGGAKASIHPKDTFDKLFPNKKCTKNQCKFTGYGGSAIDAHGISNFELTSGSLSFRHDFYVAHGFSLIGRGLRDKLQFAISINDTRLNPVHTCIPETRPGCILEQKFPKLFDSDTPCQAKNFLLSSAIDETITPVISKTRPLPFAMKDHVEKEGKQFCSLVVFQRCNKVDIDSASRHVASWRKKNGKSRICCDLREVNKEIKKDPHPLANIKSTRNSITNAKVYSKIDLSNVLPSSSSQFKH